MSTVDRRRLLNIVAGGGAERVRLVSYTLQSNEWVDVGIIAPNGIAQSSTVADADGFLGSFWIEFDSSYDVTTTRSLNQIVFTNVTTGDTYSFSGDSCFYINNTQYYNDAGSSTGTVNGIRHNVYNVWGHNNALWRYTIGKTSLKYRWYTYSSNPIKEDKHYIIFGSKTGNSANMVITKITLSVPQSTSLSMDFDYFPYELGNRHFFYNEQTGNVLWVLKQGETAGGSTGGGTAGGSAGEGELKRFAGLNISSAPLYYNGSTFVIKDSDWNHSSFNSVYGKSSGSYYFNFTQLGQFFDSRGNSFSTSSGDINNSGSKVSHAGYYDWRMPTKLEWESLVSDRVGSIINGTSRRIFAMIQLTGVTFAGNSTPSGLLLAPDGETIDGMTRALNWNSIASFSSNTGVTAAQLQEYIDAGCAFIPCGGDYYGSNGWINGGKAGPTLTATSYSSSNGVYMDMNGVDQMLKTDNVSKSTCYTMVRPVRKAGGTPSVTPDYDPVYTLTNYTCSGSSSTRINTSLRLFNASDFPDGFRLEFSGVATRSNSNISNYFASWFGCMDESGNPYPGIVVRQSSDSANLSAVANVSSGVTPSEIAIPCASGTAVDIIIVYDRSAGTYTEIVNGSVSSSPSCIITHNYPLCIGGTMSSTTSWFSDRYGYVQINYLKVYSLSGSSGSGTVVTGPEPDYTLENYTCSGSSSTSINTGLRLFNTTDFPNGFKIEFTGKVTKATTSYSNQWNIWFTCQNESGAPYQGFKISQNTADSSNLYYELIQDYQGLNSSGGVSGLSVGSTVNIEIYYDRSVLSATINGVTHSINGSVTAHNFPFSIGTGMSSATTLSDRYGYCQIDSLKVYKLGGGVNNSQSQTLTFGRFGNYMFSPGVLVYESGGFRIQSAWNESTSYNSIYGLSSGSTYFRVSQLPTGTLTFGGYSDWRVPTQAQLKTLMGMLSEYTRTGSSVNGNSGKHWSRVQTNITFHGTSNIWGYIFFPDNQTITGKTISYFDTTTATTGFTSSDISNYVSQGCIFLPSCGFYRNGWDQGDILAGSQSSTYTSGGCYGALLLYHDSYNADAALYESSFYYPSLMCRTV